MFIETLGEVFWRDHYAPKDGVDVVLFRTKVKPSPGALTYHFIQGVSHSLRTDTENYYTTTKIERGGDTTAETN